MPPLPSAAARTAILDGITRSKARARYDGLATHKPPSVDTINDALTDAAALLTSVTQDVNYASLAAQLKSDIEAFLGI